MIKVRDAQAPRAPRRGGAWQQLETLLQVPRRLSIPLPSASCCSACTEGEVPQPDVPKPEAPGDAQQGQGTRKPLTTPPRSCFLLVSQSTMVAHDSEPSVLASVPAPAPTQLPDRTLSPSQPRPSPRGVREPSLLVRAERSLTWAHLPARTKSPEQPPLLIRSLTAQRRSRHHRSGTA